MKTNFMRRYKEVKLLYRDKGLIKTQRKYGLEKLNLGLHDVYSKKVMIFIL